MSSTIGNYSGLPLVIGGNKISLFDYLGEKVTHRIQHWKSLLLLNANKETLLKAIANSIIAYAMSCFKLPTGLCKEIDQSQGKFLWNYNNDI